MSILSSFLWLLEEACRKLGNDVAHSKKAAKKLMHEVILCKERLSSTMSSAVAVRHLLNCRSWSIRCSTVWTSPWVSHAPVWRCVPMPLLSSPREQARWVVDSRSRWRRCWMLTKSSRRRSKKWWWLGEGRNDDYVWRAALWFPSCRRRWSRWRTASCGFILIRRKWSQRARHCMGVCVRSRIVNEEGKGNV